jgi:hypothetical protein
MSTSFAVVIEQTGTNLSAYVPALPGCIATAATKSDLLHRSCQFGPHIVVKWFNSLDYTNIFRYIRVNSKMCFRLLRGCGGIA